MDVQVVQVQLYTRLDSFLETKKQVNQLDSSISFWFENAGLDPQNGRVNKDLVHLHESILTKKSYLWS